MISQREVERQMARIINILDKKEEDVVEKSKINCYLCPSCKHITKTIDVDKGTTPFRFNCEKCGNAALSTFYQDHAPDREPTVEWYRPPLKQILKLRKKKDQLNHILQGGLVPRFIIKKGEEK